MCAPAVRAQTDAALGWPDRPVRVVVPYATGGANDILARLYGQKLSDQFGQPFVVGIGPAPRRSSAPSWSRGRGRTDTRC